MKQQLSFDFNTNDDFEKNSIFGGKSFYFFDFDDNIAFLSTPIVLFHKLTGQEVLLSSGEFARNSKIISRNGKFKDYYLDLCDDRGSFKFFRDTNITVLEKLTGKRQKFVKDVEEAIQKAEKDWKAPSWNCFYKAAHNQRPLSVITARGHRAETIMQGIDLMVRNGHLSKNPNYHTIYPVSNKETKIELGDDGLSLSVPELKRRAIRNSVEKAIEKYGLNPNHRFGMSDDDESNIELITEEMKALKRKYPEMKFHVILSKEGRLIRNEVLQNSTRLEEKRSKHQLELF